MNLRKSFMIITILCFSLIFASCGNDDKKSGKRSQVNASCEAINCLSSVNWNIQIPGKMFPDKVRVDINGVTVLNECVSKQKYFIDRMSMPQSLYLENYSVPKRGEVKIHVRDLGNCDSFSMFIEDNDVDFELNKNGMEQEIQINL